MREEDLQDFLTQLPAAFSFLFEERTPGGVMAVKKSLPCPEVLQEMKNFLSALSRGEETLYALNSLLLAARKEKRFPSFALLLQELVREALQGYFPPPAAKEEESLFLKECEKDPTLSFASYALEKALFFRHSFRELLELYKGEEEDPASCIILPLYKEVCRSLASAPMLNKKALALQLLAPSPYFEREDAKDPFRKGRIFRCRDGRFLLSPPLGENRKIEDFYGYREAKNLLQTHLQDFAAGKHNLPLFLTGLPGLGKTQMTIAHILAGDFTLILATPEDLQRNLEDLILALSEYPQKKFILFFDDINVSKTDFYAFRTFVGGAFTLPGHILPILSANEPFPANIASRGRAFAFPLFDEIRCMEMIGDYFELHYGTSSSTRSSRELISVVAADYVESYGQKVFEELSPRTLCRYLELHLADAKRRKRLLSLSANAMIPRPDAQAFYEQNMRLLRSLYGEEEWEKLRQEEWKF